MKCPSGVETSTWRVRVAYVDTDQGGIVHHATYLRYLEQARIEHMRTRGLSYRVMEQDDKLALPVVETQLKYRAPARFDDSLEIETWIGSINRAKLRFDSIIRCEGRVLTQAQISLACIRLPEGRITSIPQVLWTLAAGALAPKHP